MSFEIVVKKEPGYLVFTVSGEYNLEASKVMGSRVHVESVARDCRNVLLDVSQVTGSVNLMDRFKLGETARLLWGKDLRVAMVYRAEEIDGFFERSARHRGVQTRVFSDTPQALDWLLATDDSAE